ncbi:putative efflux protein MATE family [Coprococcus sp. CAG:131]|nr:putative efflux protein MATE family [Coprococcus sp. CAG:131]
MLVPSSLMQSMASFVSQNVGAGKEGRARKAMLTGMGIGLSVGVVVFIGVWFFGDKLTSIFTTDAVVIQRGFEYLRGFAPETILTAVLFSMIGYFNGHEKSLWVMIQGLIQTLVVRLPLAYYMSIQPDASLTNIGLAAPIATCAGIVLNVIFYIVMSKKWKTEKT